jgi:hypothetical protein
VAAAESQTQSVVRNIRQGGDKIVSRREHGRAPIGIGRPDVNQISCVEFVLGVMLPPKVMTSLPRSWSRFRGNGVRKKVILRSIRVR